jgi:hypothetical protein
VDELERRDVPDAYWIGDFSSDATDARNWYPYNVLPGGGDNLWFYGGEAESYTEYIDGEDVVRAPGAPCDGLYGSFGEIYVGAGYASTITQSNSLTATRLWMENGTIDQAGNDLTITGPGAEWSAAPADFYWTGGTITSSTTPATVSVVGGLPDNQVTTALIAPAEGGTVTTGSTLNFVNGAQATVEPSTINVTNVVGMKVLSGSTLTATDVTFACVVQPPNQERTVNVGAGATYIANGVTDNNRGLVVEAGGTVFIEGAGARYGGIAGPLGQSIWVQQGATALVIANGSILDGAGRSVNIAGGKLATHAISTFGNQPAAQIKGSLVIANSDITISDEAYNPANVTGHKFGRLLVDGDINWGKGTYRPVVDGTAGSTLCDVWSCLGE